MICGWCGKEIKNDDYWASKRHKDCIIHGDCLDHIWEIAYHFEALMKILRKGKTEATK